jgi:membrane-associated phospholipid phosphatase
MRIVHLFFLLLKKMSNIIIQTLESLPMSIFIAGLFGSAVTLKPVGALFSSALLVNDIIITQTFKKIFRKLGSYNKDFDNIGVRPNPPSHGCGLFRKCIHDDDETNHSYGFYSGHSSTMLFSLLFWTLYLWNHIESDSEHEQTIKIIISILFALVALSVLWSRVYIGCHSLIQVIVGSAVGAGLGTGFYFLLERKSNLLNA